MCDRKEETPCGRLFFDITKCGRSGGYTSGLKRVSMLLQAGLHDRLENRFVPVRWSSVRRGLVHAETGARVVPAAADTFLTSEVFEPTERWGFARWLRVAPCRRAAIFHDMIPLKHPEWTWRRSVRRLPGYLEMLAKFECVLAVSHASLSDYESMAAREHLKAQRRAVLPLGSDAWARPTLKGPATPPEFLCVGIIEPRKRQDLVLASAERLWRAGHTFRLHLVGRINREHGKGIVRKMEALVAEGFPVEHHGSMDDDGLRALYERCAAAVFASQAEGFGLPVAEALWLGRPVITSHVPAVEALPVGPFLTVLDPLTEVNLAEAMKALLYRQDQYPPLAVSSIRDELPTWAGAAEWILRELDIDDC